MRSISSPFRFGLLVRSSPRNPTLHFAYISSIHLSTAQLREILISISQAHSFRFPQAFFQRNSGGIYLFSATSLPRKPISSIIPHHPLVVAVISGNRVLLPVLAVNAFIPAPLCSGNYVRTSLRTPTLHFAFFRASTSAPHGISIPFLTPYIPFPQSYPCHFPTHFQRLPSFLRRVHPKIKSNIQCRCNCPHSPQSPTKKLKTKINTE